MYRLVIGNRNYSSWSLRAWLAMRACRIAFEDEVIALSQPDTAARIGAFSPAGRVPVLIDGALHVWETLAIIETLAERHPEAHLWPADAGARAHARAISSEMHAGFVHLREELPMNLRRLAGPRSGGVSAATAADIARIREIWQVARSAYDSGHGSGGPFLFGAFCAADAMFAPVVTRFQTYAVDVGPPERAYMDAVMGLAAFAEWRRAAVAEPWTIPAEEVD